MNTLYYGDNLKILREYIKDESVDLIYLDPPFNSNRNYNVLFRNESGTEAESQITAFEDGWHWKTQFAVGLIKLRLKEQFGMVPVGTRTLKSSPPYEGGVAGVSPDGVVLSEKRVSSPNVNEGALDHSGTLTNVRATDTENHPPAEAVPLLRKEGSLEYRVVGQPEDLDGAKELASKDRYGFQWWILPLIGAKAYGSETGKKEGKKGADAGIDGSMVFIDDNSGKAKRVIVSVKSGGVNVSQIRDLAHVVEREKAAIGVFLTLEPPTGPMKQEAIGEGFYHSDGWNKDYPKIQIITVEDILAGKTVNLPPNIQTFKKAGKIEVGSTDQNQLGFEQM